METQTETVTQNDSTKLEGSSPPEPKVNAIQLRPDGSLDLKDNMDAQRYANLIFQKGMAPKSYTNAGQILVAFQTGAELGMPITQALTCLAMINNTPCLHTDGPMSLVMRTGEVTFIEEYFFDKEGERLSATDAAIKEAWGAYCALERKGVKGKVEFAYSLNEALDAGLYKYPKDRNAERKRKKKPWDLYTRIMLQRRARAFPIKTLFADVIKGRKIAEYDYHALPEKGDFTAGGEIKDVTPDNRNINDEMDGL